MWTQSPKRKLQESGENKLALCPRDVLSESKKGENTEKDRDKKVMVKERVQVVNLYIDAKDMQWCTPAAFTKERETWTSTAQVCEPTTSSLPHSICTHACYQKKKKETGTAIFRKKKVKLSRISNRRRLQRHCRTFVLLFLSFSFFFSPFLFFKSFSRATKAG